MEHELLVDCSRQRLLKAGHLQGWPVFLFSGKRLWSPENTFLAYNMNSKEELFLALPRPIHNEAEGAISFLRVKNHA
jgi:hypothetical protein